MQNKSVVYSIVAILLLLSLIGLIMKARSNKKVEVEVPTEQVNLTDQVEVGDKTNSLSIDTEVTADDYLVLNDLIISKPTWVVVYNQDSEIVGKKLFDKSASPAKINLENRTIAGEEYIVKMFTDAEAGDEFNPEIDLIIKTEAGDEISTVIKAVDEIENPVKG